MKVRFVFILLIFSTSFLFSQSSQIDSLIIAVQNSSDTAKVDNLNKLAKAYWYENPELSIEHGNLAAKLSRKLKYKKGEADAINNIGGAYYFLNDFDTAVEYMEKSLELRAKIGNKEDLIIAYNNMAIIHESLNRYDKTLNYYQQALKLQRQINDKTGIAHTLNNIGSLYEKLNDYNKALENFLLSLQMNEEIDNLMGQAINLGNIGLTYGYLSNYDKALEYHFRALSLHEELGDTLGISTILGNIGMIYDDLGNNDMALEYYLKSLEMEEKNGDEVRIANSLNNIGIVYDNLQNFNQAIEYYQRALESYEKLSDMNGIANASNNIGVAYQNMNNNKNALEYLLKALKYYRELDRKKGIAATLNNVGTVYYNLKNYSKAEEFLNDALDLAIQIETRDLIIEIYQHLSNVKAAQKKYESALNYYKMYSSVKDSIFSKERLEIIAGMEATYEVQLLLEAREKEIELLQKDNEIYKLESDKQRLAMWLLYFGSAIIIVLAFVIYYRYRLNKKVTLELERQVEKRTKDLREINEWLKKEIKERKALESQLIRSERLAGVGELAAGVAHEIRNPLGNISSSAQICLSKYDLQKSVKDFIEIIQEESDKANAIIKGLLDFANPREVKLKKSDVCKILNNVLNSVNAHVINCKIKAQINCDKNIPRIMLDEKWFEQAIQNLVLNSIQAMPEGGKLNISAKADFNRKELSILIEDNGEGIPEEQISKIFDPFFTTKEDGVGLGLSLCHQIISDHNGKMNVESQIQKGTKIILTFPITYI